MNTKSTWDKANDTIAQLVRYTLVGGLAFVFDFGSLFILTEYLNIHYLVSAAFAFLLGLTINYTLSIIWVFEKRTLSNQRIEFFIFSLIGMVGLGLNEFIMWLFTDILNCFYLLSKIVSTVFVFLWNFFVRKFVLFN
ncbi:MAG: GtrA family protein [Thermodesulfobacteriota bacterium]|jgi:putative flippase GtrA|nr:MAG: GtrA family protein [Thermodesulfobacteriota bacterium]